MAQKVTHSDFPATMTIKPDGPLGGIVGQAIYFTALEDGIWIGIGPDMYAARIDWKNVGHAIRWFQTQNRAHK